MAKPKPTETILTTRNSNQNGQQNKNYRVVNILFNLFYYLSHCRNSQYIINFIIVMLKDHLLYKQIFYEFNLSKKD